LITTTSQGSAFEEVQNFFFDFSQKNNWILTLKK
jgi:hypothetical protein